MEYSINMNLSEAGRAFITTAGDDPVELKRFILSSEALTDLQQLQDCLVDQNPSGAQGLYTGVFSNNFGYEFQGNYLYLTFMNEGEETIFSQGQFTEAVTIMPSMSKTVSYSYGLSENNHPLLFNKDATYAAMIGNMNNPLSKGSSSTPLYLENGEFKECNSISQDAVFAAKIGTSQNPITKGASSIPLYLENGEFKVCDEISASIDLQDIVLSPSEYVSGPTVSKRLTDASVVWEKYQYFNVAIANFDIEPHLPDELIRFQFKGVNYAEAIQNDITKFNLHEYLPSVPAIAGEVDGWPITEGLIIQKALVWATGYRYVIWVDPAIFECDENYKPIGLVDDGLRSDFFNYRKISSIQPSTIECGTIKVHEAIAPGVTPENLLELSPTDIKINGTSVLPVHAEDSDMSYDAPSSNYLLITPAQIKQMIDAAIAEHMSSVHS